MMDIVAPFQEEESSSEIICPGTAAERRLRQFEDAWDPSTPLLREGTSDPNDARRSVLAFCEADFHIGKLIGRGSFSTVHRVFLIEELDHAFALKRLKKCVVDDPTISKTAAADLAVETSILTNLKHQNIITLHGVKEGDMIESFRLGSFFIVLDLMCDTLDVRMEKWRRERDIFGLRSRSKVASGLRDVVIGIAKGMEYLHSMNIIFRYVCNLIAFLLLTT